MCLFRTHQLVPKRFSLDRFHCILGVIRQNTKDIIKKKEHRNISRMYGLYYLILERYVFDRSYFPYDRQNGKNKEYEYNFQKICRYLNLVKNQRIILYQIEIQKLLQHDNFGTNYGEVYVIFMLTMKRDPFAGIKGKLLL